MNARGFCSCGLDTLDNADCAGRSAAPLASSLLVWLLLASLELLDSRLASGDECEVAKRAGSLRGRRQWFFGQDVRL